MSESQRGRFVRMEAGCGREPGVGGGELERAVSGQRGFTDHDDSGDPTRPGAIEDLASVGIVRRVGEMAVGVG